MPMPSHSAPLACCAGDLRRIGHGMPGNERIKERVTLRGRDRVPPAGRGHQEPTSSLQSVRRCEPLQRANEVTRAFFLSGNRCQVTVCGQLGG